MRPSRIKRRKRPAEPRRGFTLVELLVVIFIIVLVSAATIPAILPALNSRRVSEGSRLLQAELSRARDLAVRANAPCGIRLIPDPIDPARPYVLTCSRLIALESGPDYEDGIAARHFDLILPQPPSPPGPPFYQDYRPAPGLPSNADNGPFLFTNANYPYLVAHQAKASLQTPPGIFVPNSPTSWFFNIRQGEKFRFNDSGAVYTVAGPITDPRITVMAGNDLANSLRDPNFTQPNPDRFINYGAGYISTIPADANGFQFDFLFLVNGDDDNNNGYIDEGFDGIDNDGDGIIDPGFNGKDDNGDGHIDEWQELYLHALGPNGTAPFIYPGIPFPDATHSDGGFPNAGPRAQYPNEYEQEDFVKLRQPILSKLSSPPPNYSITRRPVPVEGAREIAMPTNVVIDLTTWDADTRFNTVPERSRLPVDPFTLFVDVMVAPNGQVVVAGASANASPPVNYPFYHFWITEREEVAQPTALDIPNGKTFSLPMPRDSGFDPRIPAIVSLAQAQAFNNPVLRAERRLLSINTRSGAIVPTSLETFYLNNTSFPYESAESGVRDTQP